jgi:hypothetical protein
MGAVEEDASKRWWRVPFPILDHLHQPTTTSSSSPGYKTDFSVPSATTPM